MITPLLGCTPDPHSRNFDPHIRCAYYSNIQGHSIEDCCALKREIERMIQEKLIVVQNIDTTSATRNPSSTHGNAQLYAHPFYYPQWHAPVPQHHPGPHIFIKELLSPSFN